MSEEEITKEIKEMTLSAGDSWADTVVEPVTSCMYTPILYFNIHVNIF